MTTLPVHCLLQTWPPSAPLFRSPVALHLPTQTTNGVSDIVSPSALDVAVHLCRLQINSFGANRPMCFMMTLTALEGGSAAHQIACQVLQSSFKPLSSVWDHDL